MVTTNTAQNITDIKTFNAMFNAKRPTITAGRNEQYGFRVIEDSNYGALAIGASTRNGSWLTNDYIVIKGQDLGGAGICLYPSSQGVKKDLGRTANKWRDLYLSGSLKDGTNSVTVADLAALVAYAKSQGWIQ